MPRVCVFCPFVSSWLPCSGFLSLVPVYRPLLPHDCILEASFPSSIKSILYDQMLRVSVLFPL